ncbi:hypothetical protein [Edaphocola aurantiacus]|uniref:hypothetical protein n=1 Tax=Edaphocola aurantiacus TaxID=2601682 RepID=UPI001C95C133|nr:hypothetical protein [Edaphocola aurantiacus]
MSSSAQKSSFPDPKEVKAYLKEALRANFSYSPSLLAKKDSFHYKKNKIAFDQLKRKNVGVFIIYNLCLFKEINNYDFADNFNQYFYWDTGRPKIVFFNDNLDFNQAFASTYPINSGSQKLKPINSLVDLPEFNFYLNWQGHKNTFLTLAFGEFFIIKDNSLYILKGDKMEKASDYFKAHSDAYPINKLTAAFLGFKDELYQIPKQQ